MSDTVGILEFTEILSKKTPCKELKAMSIVNNSGFSQQGFQLQNTLLS